jgi:hypothetical protein
MLEAGGPVTPGEFADRPLHVLQDHAAMLTGSADLVNVWESSFFLGVRPGAGRPAALSEAGV